MARTSRKTRPNSTTKPKTENLFIFPMVISQGKRAKFEHYIEVANKDVMQVVIRSGRSRKVSGNME
jgi:hypothetical protein